MYIIIIWKFFLKVMVSSTTDYIRIIKITWFFQIDQGRKKKINELIKHVTSYNKYPVSRVRYQLVGTRPFRLWFQWNQWGIPQILSKKKSNYFIKLFLNYGKTENRLQSPFNLTSIWSDITIYWSYASWNHFLSE